MSEDGFVFGCILRADDGSSVIHGWEGISFLEPGEGTLWLHLDYAAEKTKNWLYSKSGIDPVTCDALLEEGTRPRIAASREGILLIFRGVNFNPGADPEDMVALRMWIEENRIISMRQRKVMAVDDLRKEVESGRGPERAGEFLSMVVERLTDRMGDIVSEIDGTVDELEGSVIDMESHELRSKLSHIRRQTISLRRYIAPQRDVLNRLCNERVEWLTDRDRVRLREAAERTGRFVEDLDSARDRAAITQEELNSRLSEVMNRTMYILSIVAAVFLPLSLLTGLLGINVGGIPGADNKWAFSEVTLLILVLAAFQLWYFKRKKWF